MSSTTASTYYVAMKISSYNVLVLPYLVSFGDRVVDHFLLEPDRIVALFRGMTGSVYHTELIHQLNIWFILIYCDKYLVVILQLIGTSYSCYNNNCITKFWAPVLNFSIHTRFSWQCFLEKFSMLSSSFKDQVHHYKLIWSFQNDWFDSSTKLVN